MDSQDTSPQYGGVKLTKKAKREEKKKNIKVDIFQT